MSKACSSDRDTYKNMTLWDQCEPLKNSVGNKGWCYTKTFLNDSAIVGTTGYCDLRCKSQEQIVDPNFNLASKEHNDLWSEHIFMMDAVSHGHCYTYNPKYHSFPRNKGQFYAMLGKYI